MQIAVDAISMRALAASASTVLVLIFLMPCLALVVDPALASSNRWESVACALSHMGVPDPFAWGAVTAVRGAPAVLHEPGVVPALHWLAKSLADGYFVPVDACAAAVRGVPLLLQHRASSEADAAQSRSDAVACVRGTMYFGLIALDRFKLAMLIDQASAVAISTLRTAGGGAWELPMHVLKLLVTAADPGDGLAGYFLSMELDLACHAGACEAAAAWAVTSARHDRGHASAGAGGGGGRSSSSCHGGCGGGTCQGGTLWRSWHLPWNGGSECRVARPRRPEPAELVHRWWRQLLPDQRPRAQLTSG